MNTNSKRKKIKMVGEEYNHSGMLRLFYDTLQDRPNSYNFGKGQMDIMVLHNTWMTNCYFIWPLEYLLYLIGLQQTKQIFLNNSRLALVDYDEGFKSKLKVLKTKGVDNEFSHFPFHKPLSEVFNDADISACTP